MDGYRKLKDESEYRKDGVEGKQKTDEENVIGEKAPLIEKDGGASMTIADWSRKSAVTLALTVLTSSQGILIAYSKKAGKYDYSVTTANLCVEVTKCLLSLLALMQIWRKEGFTEDNRLSTSWSEIYVYPIPAFLYLIKNLLQYYIFLYVDAPSYQILKNLNIISTGVLYRLFLQKRLSGVQWSALSLLALGCTITQMTNQSDRVFDTGVTGWVIAVFMALLSGAAGVYTELIIKKRPARNINVQNVYLYLFGIFFNVIAIFVQDYDHVASKGFFYGYTFITAIMVMNHALSGIAVSMVMKFADNIVKVYSTSVAMLLTTLISIPLFGFTLSFPFVMGTSVASIAVYLHYQSPKAK
eukprot:jgi/Chlat1/3667/Chrsp24S03842